jgi:hypothetical protein
MNGNHCPLAPYFTSGPGRGFAVLSTRRKSSISNQKEKKIVASSERPSPKGTRRSVTYNPFKAASIRSFFFCLRQFGCPINNSAGPNCTCKVVLLEKINGPERTFQRDIMPSLSGLWASLTGRALCSHEMGLNELFSGMC